MEEWKNEEREKNNVLNLYRFKNNLCSRVVWIVGATN